IPYPRSLLLPYYNYKHLGVYAYRRQFLLNLPALNLSTLEKIEGLEQLRFLDNGIPIEVVLVDEDSIGVDTLEDLERVKVLLENFPNPQAIR
ncbi:MAG: cytidylyltransferase domain-containing protein, partial [Acidobacteriota bacterium]